MPDQSTLVVFAAASLALIAIPGPSVIFIVTRSLEHGRRAGLVSMLGVEAGALIHVVAAAIGLSALLASSAVAFTIVKYVGAAYLIVLGLQALRSGRTGQVEPPPPVTRAKLFRQGAVVNLFNPKVAIFFLAFLPQFVDPARGAVALQAGLLGMCFIALAVLSDSVYALVAGSLGDHLRRSASLRRLLDRVSGFVYLTLGAAAALTGDRPQPREAP
ncbi:MAG: LysE family translocator [Solirubrobacterales bacterium]|nr:LysE family translocator [Solirubrobacterales bacterium]